MDPRAEAVRGEGAFLLDQSGYRKMLQEGDTDEDQERLANIEELITSADELQQIWILRKLLHPMDELAAAECLIDTMRDTKTNADFFDLMKR